MCADILASPLFHTFHLVDPVSSNNKVIYANLRERHANIYGQFYDSKKPSSRDMIASNPYKLRDVTVEEVVVQEDVYICLARNRVTQKIIEYFISLSYNIVNDDHYKYDQKKGIFVFAFDERKDVVVIALAEEPGYISEHAQGLIKVTQYKNFQDGRIFSTYFLYTLGKIFATCIPPTRRGGKWRS